MAVGVPSSNLLERTRTSAHQATVPASGDRLSDHDTTVTLVDNILVSNESRRGVSAAVVDVVLDSQPVLDDSEVKSTTAAQQVGNGVTRGDGDLAVAVLSADNRRHLDVPLDESLDSVLDDSPGVGAAGIVAFLERHILCSNLHRLPTIVGVHLGPGRVKGWGLGGDSKSLQLGLVFIQGQRLGCTDVSTVHSSFENAIAEAL